MRDEGEGGGGWRREGGWPAVGGAAPSRSLFLSLFHFLSSFSSSISLCVARTGKGGKKGQQVRFPANLAQGPCSPVSKNKVPVFSSHPAGPFYTPGHLQNAILGVLARSGHNGEVLAVQF